MLLLEPPDFSHSPKGCIFRLDSLTALLGSWRAIFLSHDLEIHHRMVRPQHDEKDHRTLCWRGSKDPDPSDRKGEPATTFWWGSRMALWLVSTARCSSEAPDQVVERLVDPRPFTVSVEREWSQDFSGRHRRCTSEEDRGVNR